MDADQRNVCCIEVQYMVYRDAKLLNDKGFMTRTLTVQRRVLTWSLHRCRLYMTSSPTIILITWLEGWDTTVRSRSESSMLHMQRLSGLLWIVSLIPPNNDHLRMFESLAAGQTSHYPLFVVSYTVLIQMLPGSPLPPSLTIGGI